LEEIHDEILARKAVVVVIGRKFGIGRVEIEIEVEIGSGRPIR